MHTISRHYPVLCNPFIISKKMVLPTLLKQRPLALALSSSCDEYVTSTGAVQELFNACPDPDNFLFRTRAFKNNVKFVCRSSAVQLLFILGTSN